jgi:hypothetical protein
MNAQTHTGSDSLKSGGPGSAGTENRCAGARHCEGRGPLGWLLESASSGREREIGRPYSFFVFV